MKEQHEFVIGVVKQAVQNLVFYGVISLLVGILIMIYPDLLGILVGLLLIIASVQAFRFAYMLNKYSKIKINF